LIGGESPNFSNKINLGTALKPLKAAILLNDKDKQHY